MNIGIVCGGRNRDDRRGSDGYPGRYPDRGCGDFDYDRGDDDRYREEAKRRAEWEREDAKRYCEQQSEADKRRYEQQYEAENRFSRAGARGVEAATRKRREHVKALGEADRERFEGWRGN